MFNFRPDVCNVEKIRISLRSMGVWRGCFSSVSFDTYGVLYKKESTPELPIPIPYLSSVFYSFWLNKGLSSWSVPVLMIDFLNKGISFLRIWDVFFTFLLLRHPFSEETQKVKKVKTYPVSKYKVVTHNSYNTRPLKIYKDLELFDT